MIRKFHPAHRNYLLVGLVLLSLIWLIPGCALFSKKKPKVKTCLMCHKESAQMFQQQEFHHASVAEGKCKDCHLSHGVANKLVLVKEKAELCYSCHLQKQTEFQKGNIHYPTGKGDCTECHDPHGASNRDFLSKTGQSLCFSCHLEKGKELSVPNVHAPAKEGNCGICHDSHTSEFPKLLTAIIRPATKKIGSSWVSDSGDVRIASRISLTVCDGLKSFGKRLIPDSFSV